MIVSIVYRIHTPSTPVIAFVCVVDSTTVETSYK